MLRTVGVLPKDTSARIDSAGALSNLIGISILCSLAAGGIATVISRGSSKYLSLILAFLLLLTGVAVQWSDLPANADLVSHRVSRAADTNCAGWGSIGEARIKYLSNLSAGVRTNGASCLGSAEFPSFV